MGLEPASGVESQSGVDRISRDPPHTHTHMPCHALIWQENGVLIHMGQTEVVRQGEKLVRDSLPESAALCLLMERAEGQLGKAGKDQGQGN